MQRFVFVHGAWHDGRCWDALVDELARRGARGTGLDLPAGDPDAGIEEYVAAVLDAIDTEDEPGESVVVAHSFGGLILPVAADRRRVAGIVYVAAFPPQPGKTFNQQARQEPDMFAPTWKALTGRQVKNTDGSTAWPVDAAIEAFYHDCDPQTAEEAAGRLRAQHWGVANEACPLEALPELPTRYIACRDDRSINFNWAVRTARERLGVEAEVMDTSHSPMLSRPGELAERLLRGDHGR